VQRTLFPGNVQFAGYLTYRDELVETITHHQHARTWDLPFPMGLSLQYILQMGGWKPPRLAIGKALEDVSERVE
jgi:hypothetical protein